ncbi:heparan-alpha-glucosaminide N-acetyltransferase domain-containing protein [Nocardia sp. NPDC057668]|uniref:heparan-alpha-glucosaminide N-acetyltransferase domain-containing protein n=1 Tax=Nocardia sp. NPDC057668 TaxID=3346202 RepID=UPI0036707C4D
MTSARTVVSERSATQPGLPRVLALDAARGIAVLGMFAVHTGPPEQVFGSGWLSVFAGRSAALFAVLAGVSLTLMSGGRTPRTGRAGRRDLVRIAARAVLIAALGLALAQLHSGIGIMIILTYYGLYFLLALPLVRLGARALTVLAAGWAIAGPIASFLIREHLDQSTAGGHPSADMLTSWSGLGEAATMLMFTGAYPAITWMPFVLAGMALGRWGIRELRALPLLGIGALLALIGYGGSWLLQHPFGGRAHLVDLLTGLGVTDIDPAVIIDLAGLGTVGTNSWWWLTIDNAHSGTPFEIFGSVGVAFLVIGALTAVLPAARIPLYPLICAGSCALSLYIAQVVAVAVLVPLDADTPPAGAIHGPSWQLLALLVIGSLVLATLWRSMFRRGPAEWLLHRVTMGITDALVPADPR